MRLYLSSSFSTSDLLNEPLLELRQILKARAAFHKIEVVLGEDDTAVKTALDEANPPGVLEGCARLMSTCDAFFGLLFARHGTKVELDHDALFVRSAVSFFEAELLEACVTQKPVHVAQVRGYTPSPAMDEFLKLVGPCLARQIVYVDRSELEDEFDRFCQAICVGVDATAPTLIDQLSLSRLRRQIPKEVFDPQLGFLGDVLRQDGDGNPDPLVIEDTLRRLEMGTRDRPLGQLERLTYLWIAIRELARASVRERRNDLASAMDRTLVLWNSAAAWYGLHGAHPMGCLAALNDLTLAKREAGRSDLPLGARASAYYSIGAQLRSRPAARHLFHQSLATSSEAIKLAPDDPSDLLQMTASAQARLAVLGSKWRYFRALGDFKASLKWREANGAADERIGEAQNAYAHALFRLPWMRKEALKLADEGSRLIASAPGGLASGFYFRAERKRAEMLRDSGRPDDAKAALLAARKLAEAAQAFDQVRNLDTSLGTLDAASARAGGSN